MNKNFYTFKDSSITYFFCIVSMLGASLLLSIIGGIVVSASGVEATQVTSSNWFLYLNMFLSGIAFFFVYLGVNLKYKKNFMLASRIQTKFNWVIALVAVLLGIVVFLGGLNLTYFTNNSLSKVFSIPAETSISTGNFGVFVLQVFLLAVLPAVFEEVTFRGIIYNGLRQKFRASTSIILSALLFMLIHFSIFKTIYQFVLGIVLGLLVYCTGSIIYGIIFHFVNNFIIILLNYVAPNGSIFELVKNGEAATTAWGAKEIILAVVFFVISIGIIALIFYFLKKYTNKHKNYYNLETTNAPLNFKEDETNIPKNIETTGHVWYSLSLMFIVVLIIISLTKGGS